MNYCGKQRKWFLTMLDGDSEGWGGISEIFGE
jgi:hypothetical protein